MQNPQLQWGLSIPPGEYLAAWGARAIFESDRIIDIVHDRQDHAGSDLAVKALCTWLGKVAIPELREKARTDRRAEKFTIGNVIMNLTASTNVPSSGYLYMRATLPGLETVPAEDKWKWSGDFMPRIGDTVHVSFNGLGDGLVLGYFTEYGWIGVLVHLFNPPEWHRRRNPTGVASAFGAEIRKP